MSQTPTRTSTAAPATRTFTPIADSYVNESSPTTNYGTSTQLRADGSPFVFTLGDREGFTSHDWELGIGGGDYGGANLINAYGAFSLTDNMKVEISLSQFLGNASNGYKAEAGINHVLFPEWRLSPFIGIGTGVVYTEPRATIVLPEDRTDQTAYAGAGLRFYLTRRFFVRADYRWHTIFTSRDDNQELEEWKVQIACFF